MTNDKDSGFSEWAILELMGHRRLAGLVSEANVFDTMLVRIDVPNSDGAVTQFYSPSAVYCITPTSEQIAREVAERSRPEPVHRWELPAPERDGELAPF